MAQGSVTITGLDEVRAAVTELPRAVTLAVRAVAWRTSRRVYSSAQARLNALTHGTGETARNLRVTEHEERKSFVVDVGPMAGRPANLPLWIERGTIKMRARPFMRPSLEAESATYIREVEDAVQRVGTEALG